MVAPLGPLAASHCLPKYRFAPAVSSDQEEEEGVIEPFTVRIASLSSEEPILTLPALSIVILSNPAVLGFVDAGEVKNRKAPPPPEL